MSTPGGILREARERRGLTLAQCEETIRVRARHLAAIEEGRFELLPERPYARGFVRAYARLLDVDARPLLEACEAREEGAPGPPEALQPLPGPATLREWREGLPLPAPARRAVLPATALALAAALVVAVLIAAPGRPGPAAEPAAPAGAAAEIPPAEAAHAVAPAPADEPRPAPAPPRSVPLELRGAPPTGSWVSLRRGGADGPVLYEGVLPPGAVHRVRLEGDRGHWLRVGWTDGLRVRLAGERVGLEGGTASFLVSRHGIAPEA